MNFYFEEGDIVALKNTDGMGLYILVKGFDPIPTGYRIWWADPYNGERSFPSKRIRTYTNKMIRVRRPKEEARLKARAEKWKQTRMMAVYTRRAREEIRNRARMRRHGFSLNDLPFAIPAGKWPSPEGVRQILTDLGFRPETVEKRVRIMERLFNK